MGDVLKGDFSRRRGPVKNETPAEAEPDKIGEQEKQKRIKILFDKLQGRDIKKIMTDFFSQEHRENIKILEEPFEYGALENTLKSVQRGYEKITDQALEKLEKILAGLKPEQGLVSVSDLSEFRAKKNKKS